MKKETVYIPLTTPEECKRAYEILSKHNEPMWEGSSDLLLNGIIKNTDTYIDFDEGEWITGRFDEIKGPKISITLSQLDELLGGGNPHKLNLTEVRKKVDEILSCLTKEDFEKWCAEDKTSSLRKELEEKLDTSKVIRVEVITKRGREFVTWDENNKVKIDFQDDNRTLKIFIQNNND